MRSVRGKTRKNSFELLTEPSENAHSSFLYFVTHGAFPRTARPPSQSDPAVREWKNLFRSTERRIESRQRKDEEPLIPSNRRGKSDVPGLSSGRPRPRGNNFASGRLLPVARRSNFRDHFVINSRKAAPLLYISVARLGQGNLIFVD